MYRRGIRTDRRYPPSRGGGEGGETSGSAGEHTGIDGDRRIERRRNDGLADSPTDILTRLPAVVVLERVPVPSLAMTRGGSILFSNTAFADMVGYQRNGLARAAFSRLFNAQPAAISAQPSVDDR